MSSPAGWSGREAELMALAAIAPEASMVVQPRLLSGPPVLSGAESLASHVGRLGERPAGGHWLIDVLEAADLRGRGGGAFPAGRKWRSVYQHGHGRAVVIINAAEGEPLSAQDRVLL